jgi:hypothetical protein
MDTFNALEIIDKAAAETLGRRAVPTRAQQREHDRLLRRQQRAARTKALADPLISGLEILQQRSRFQFEVRFFHNDREINITTNLRTPFRSGGGGSIVILPSKIQLCGFTHGRTRHFHVNHHADAAASALKVMTAIVVADPEMEFDSPRPRPANLPVPAPR